MDSKLQQELYKKYPEIFIQKDLPKEQTAMCWGISCGNGWFNLIDELCGNIQNRLQNVNRNKLQEDYLICQAVQVKEKFGGLCFYIFGGDDYINGLISMAESMSYHICTECGDPSVKHENNRGWIYTLCQSCTDKR